MSKGHLVVVSAPSGSGKTTIVRAILTNHPSMLFSVSATTRPRRELEVDGKDYFFLSREEFERRIQHGDLVEWEEIYGNLYGTLKSEVEKVLSAGKTMLFDIDVKGGLSIKRQYPDALLIFIRPPSIAVLEARLRNRKTEDDETFRRRMARVAMEMDMAPLFDHQVINDTLDIAIEEVDRLIVERLARNE